MAFVHPEEFWCVKSCVDPLICFRCCIQHRTGDPVPLLARCQLQVRALVGQLHHVGSLSTLKDGYADIFLYVKERLLTSLPLATLFSLLLFSDTKPQLNQTLEDAVGSFVGIQAGGKAEKHTEKYILGHSGREGKN